MKIRSFYPRQVLRRLQGDHADLSASETAALRFLMLRSRKMGLAVVVGPVPDATGQERALGQKVGTDLAGLMRVKIFRVGSDLAGFPAMTKAALDA